MGWGAGATSYEYNRDGTVDYQARTNGVRTNYGYDGRGIISSVQHTTDHDLTKRDYWRDKRDRILAWKRGNDPTYNLMEDGRGNRYECDYEGQLKTASYRAENPENGATTPYRNDIFHYDKLGNREGSNYLASRGLQDFKSKNNGLNQYHKWWPYSFTFYDDDLDGWGAPGRANGVLMVDGWITGYYNALNQPVAITTSAWAGGGNSMWFGYDPLGRCVKRWVGPAIGTPPNQHAPPANTNPATYYYYDGSNLIQEGSSGGPPDRVYVHGGRVDEIVASAVGGVWSQHQYDAQGNCILLTDANGVIREQYDYDAFGFPYVYDRWGNYIGGLPGANRFLFAGREWIKELRLYDYRARMYQPELGRFLQPDPQEFAAGDYNLYRYCHNDPVNKSDPTGLVELLNEFQRDWQWDFACRGDSGNSFQGDSNSYINRGHDHTSMGTNKEADGNYNDTNMEHHLREGQPDGGTTKLTMGNEKGGVARPQLNWWVSENHMDDKTILGELEHVSRDLWSLGEGGDLSKAIKKYNANPDGTDAKKMLENARQSEHRWHLDNIHGSPNRHDLNKNGELWKKMTPAEIQNAIRTLAPIEDPRPHYLGY